MEPNLIHSIKKDLYKRCIEFAENQIVNARQAIESAEQASADDTKSSAGDKYETGREMMSQEIKRLSVQLQEATKLINAMNNIDISKSFEKVKSGSLVISDNGNYFISIGAGRIQLGEEVYYAISQASPLAVKLIGLKAGDSTDHNNKIYRIKSVI